jgi:flavin-binding protein dodecin
MPEAADRTLRDLRIAEVVKMDMKVEDGKMSEFRNPCVVIFQVRELGRGPI